MLLRLKSLRQAEDTTADLEQFGDDIGLGQGHAAGEAPMLVHDHGSVRLESFGYLFGKATRHGFTAISNYRHSGYKELAALILGQYSVPREGQGYRMYGMRVNHRLEQRFLVDGAVHPDFR